MDLRALVLILALGACTSIATDGDTFSSLIETSPHPQLIEPPDGSVFDSPTDVKLRWEWVRPLEQGEAYDVRVWREGEAPQGIAWSYDTNYDLANWLQYQPPGEFYWSVAVLRGADGQVEEFIADETPPARFSVNDTRLPGERVLQVPPGFKAHLYGQVRDASMPTAITFGPGGHLYMLTLEGDLYVLADEDGDGAADDALQVLHGAEFDIHHAVGMAFDQDTLYLSDSGRVSRIEDEDGDGVYDALTPLVENLPSLQYIDHSNNGIAIGQDRMLYVAVGATSDHGPLSDPLEAAILRMDLDGNNLEVYASGLRNPYDLTFSPTGDLFAVDNSPDQLSKTLTYLPPEELNHIRQGYNYGFPDVFGRLTMDSDTEKPVTEFYTSVASAGLTYYAADAFPDEYRNGIFVAQWGTAAEEPLERGLNNGRQIVFVELTPTDDGTYTGDWETFATFDQSIASLRPIDVTVGPDGALYVAEWNTAAIYRIIYDGVFDEPTSEVEADWWDESTSAELELGEAVYLNGSNGAPACVSCHALETQRTGLGPSLLSLRARYTGESLADYVRESIIDPDATIAQGYRAGYMYQNYAERLSDEEIDALVAYVLHLSAGG